MIGEVQKQSVNGVNKWYIAIRDAIVVFLLFLLTNLIRAGYPPTIETFYMALLPALLMGIISYMHAAGIETPTQ